MVTFSLTGEHSTYRVVVETQPRHDRVAVFVHCPVKVPPPRLSLKAELLTWVNYHSLEYGHVEVDFDDGEVAHAVHGLCRRRNLGSHHGPEHDSYAGRYFGSPISASLARHVWDYSYNYCNDNDNDNLK
ncbi:hypothetical protein ACA910_014585 [Epithemia clementina (nom. ined.)]